MNKIKNIFMKYNVYTILIPFLFVLILCSMYLFIPQFSIDFFENIRIKISLLFDNYYLYFGLFMLIISFVILISPLGKVRLGKKEDKQYSFFKWGAMLFTSGLAADIIFYSFCEWIFYFNENRLNENIQKYGGNKFDWSLSYSLFHWGFIPWSFYIVLALCFGFMLYVKKIDKQSFSKALKPILGKYCDSFIGHFADSLTIFALIAGTATTFSLATPLLSGVICDIFHIKNMDIASIIVLIIICIIYSSCAYFGMENISKLANICMYLFIFLLLYIFLFGGQTLNILSGAASSIKYSLSGFIDMATTRDIGNKFDFSRSYTVFYWAYWIVWSVAAPCFIGCISRGRTLRETILGGYFFGICGSYSSFIILGGYSLGMQKQGITDFVLMYEQTGDIYNTIVSMINYLPFNKFILIIIIFVLIAFYATTFDSLTLIAANFSYKKLGANEEAGKNIKLFWSITLILLPIALLKSENTISGLQTISIISSLPIAIMIFFIVIGFLKDLIKYYLSHKLDK